MLDSTVQASSLGMTQAKAKAGQTYHLSTLQSASHTSAGDDDDVKDVPVFRMGPEDSFDNA